MCWLLLNFGRVISEVKSGGRIKFWFLLFPLPPPSPLLPSLLAGAGISHLSLVGRGETTFSLHGFLYLFYNRLPEGESELYVKI